MTRYFITTRGHASEFREDESSESYIRVVCYTPVNEPECTNGV